MLKMPPGANDFDPAAKVLQRPLRHRSQGRNAALEEVPGHELRKMVCRTTQIDPHPRFCARFLRIRWLILGRGVAGVARELRGVAAKGIEGVWLNWGR